MAIARKCYLWYLVFQLIQDFSVYGYKDQRLKHRVCLCCERKRLTRNVAHLVVFIHSQASTITGAILSCWNQGITHGITGTHYALLLSPSDSAR